MAGSYGADRDDSFSLSREIYSLKGKRVWVAGHTGMVGSALMRRLADEGCELLTVSRSVVDLTRQEAAETWMAQARPQAVFLAAAKVGGILANSTHPADFLYDNIAISTNIIEAARKVRVEKLLNLGSSCIYPKLASQPMSESALLTGPLEETNQWYAIAKIAGIKLCQAYRSQFGCDFISAMPTNLYGPGDNFDLASSHVVPALLRKAHDARVRGDKELIVWGTGLPRREFLYVDDCADALVFLMKAYSQMEHINVGSGADLTIRELAELVARTVGFEGAIVSDPSKPDGAPQKLMAADRLRSLGWMPRTSLSEGLDLTYKWYIGGSQSRLFVPSAAL
jgi:GDP-L-fucose synthase